MSRDRCWMLSRGTVMGIVDDCLLAFIVGALLAFWDIARCLLFISSPQFVVRYVL